MDRALERPSDDSRRVLPVDLSASPAGLDDILEWREMYRSEMHCQIIHDSIHQRPGWTQEYLLKAGAEHVGYGSVAVAGPWTGRPTVYEFYVAPHRRSQLFDLFRTMLTASGAVSIEVQSNDPLAITSLHMFARDVVSLSILFHDEHVTNHSPHGAAFRTPTATEAADIPQDQLRWHGVVEVEGQIAATGGILFHYNPPYGDIFMEVAEPFRGRGIGSFLVQELKRTCYEGGYVPAARCNPANIASRRTLQRAGFAPCGHMLMGSVSHDS